MKSPFFAAAFAAAALVASANSTNDLLTVGSDVERPTLSAGINYRTMKIERGQVENDESVFGYEVELEWYGLFGGIESCNDLTGVNGRRGRYNEIESRFGYGRSFGDFTARTAYVYKKCVLEEADTQEVEIELEYETPWVTPFLELACDTHDKAGAFYGAFGLEREWQLTDGLTAVANGGIGFGNAYRNDADFESEKLAFREMHLGTALEIELCPHVKLVPGIDFYDYFTRAQRRTYDKFNGFVAVAGCYLTVEF